MFANGNLPADTSVAVPYPRMFAKVYRGSVYKVSMDERLMQAPRETKAIGAAFRNCRSEPKTGQLVHLHQLALC
jgi:hypothetical protein